MQVERRQQARLQDNYLSFVNGWVRFVPRIGRRYCGF
jgi:hypothetical protein